MKQRKKSFGMRISAFVLSFAMVCTLLAGVNVVAFAADDTDTVPVSKFYNDAKKGGDGEHLFTKDADEISWLSSLKTWNNEGVAWKAPVSSSTSVYRCYNPNSGEHLYVDEGYADYLAGMGWNKEKLAFYSDDEMGVPVYRLWNGQDGVGSHHFTTDSGEVEWLVSQGWVKEDVAFYGVKDLSNTIEMIDLNGFQADGSALATDDLYIVFGSEYGTPKNVSWYSNGGLVATFPSGALTIMDGLDASAAVRNALSPSGTMTGTFYATVENTDGTIFTTNIVNITETPNAKLSGFTVADAYDAYDDEMIANPITIDEETGEAVIDVTVDKYFSTGVFYLLDVDDLENPQVVGFATSNTAGMTDVKTAGKFVNKALYDDAAGTNFDGAIYYKDDNNAMHYKLTANNFANGLGPVSLTRGCTYALLFDPAGTDISGYTEEEVQEFLLSLPNAGFQTCPYVTAPSSIAVTKYDKTNRYAEVTFLGSDGKPLAWYNSVVGNVGLDAIAFYAIDSKTPDYEEDIPCAIEADDIEEGVATMDLTAPQAKQYAYAAIATTEGIFDAESIEMVSPVVETVTAVAPADQMLLAENLTTDPTSATITFNSLAANADGTVFIVNGKDAGIAGGDDAATKYGKIAAKFDDDPTTALKYARVSGGDKTVTVKGVFNQTQIKNAANYENLFVAIFVPDDLTRYSTMSSVILNGEVITPNTPFTLVSLDAKLSFATKDVAVEAGTGATITVGIKNQFGQDTDAIIMNAVVNAGMKNGGTTEYPVAPKLTAQAGTNKIIIKPSGVDGDGTRDTVGDTWTYELANKQIVKVVVKEVAAGVATKYTVSLT